MTNRIRPEDMPPDDAQPTRHLHVVKVDLAAPTPVASVGLPIFRDTDRTTLTAHALIGGKSLLLDEGFAKQTADDAVEQLHRFMVYEHEPDKFTLALLVWRDGKAARAYEEAHAQEDDDGNVGAETLPPDDVIIAPLHVLTHYLQHIAGDTLCSKNPKRISYADGKPRPTL